MEQQESNLENATAYRKLSAACRILDLRLEELEEISDKEVKREEERVLSQEAEVLLRQCRSFRNKYRKVYNLAFIEKIAVRVKAAAGNL